MHKHLAPPQGHQPEIDFPLASNTTPMLSFSMPKKSWVYIMSSKTGTLYTGVTSNLDRRVFEHKQHVKQGFTAAYHCTSLVWFEEHSDIRQAIAQETQIKSWLRSKKIALIESKNPHWNDLAEHWGSELCLKVGPHPKERSSF